MSRREFLIAGSVVAGALRLGLNPARATPDEAQDVIRAIAGSAAVKPGRVRLDLPPLVENGNTVPLKISVESPMTPTDHVKAIYLLAEKNPQPVVAVVRFGPRAGRASVETRIRLADSQTVVAICEMSDGSFWSGTADSVVTIAACVEPGY